MKLLLMIVLPLASVFLLTAADDEKQVTKVDATPVPVDDDMHHLMEYVFEPAYKRLKVSVATEPKDRNDWSAIKGDVLTLAESSNLLLHRLPDEDSENWIKLSVKSREAGGELYQSARKKDFEATVKHAKLLLESCNACHDAFADGDYQLSLEPKQAK